uniref:Uncharacterized protein n=1 Tax=Eutreptiella gymnastica TaxID=73025 RepID=A0A7S1JF42_9EUGL
MSPVSAVSSRERWYGMTMNTDFTDIKHPDNCAIPHLQPQFEAFTGCTLLIDKTKFIMYMNALLAGISLIAMIVTVPAVFLVVYSFEIENRTPCIPGTYVSYAYQIVEGLLGLTPPLLLLVWCYGWRNQVLFLYIPFMLLKIASFIAIWVTVADNWRVIVFSVTSFVYWILCTGYFKSFEQCGLWRSICLFTFPILLFIASFTMVQYLFPLFNRPVLTAVYRGIGHPLWYFIVIRLAAGCSIMWSRSSTSLTLLSMPFLFTGLKIYLGRYAETHLHFTFFVLINIGMISADVFRFLVYKWTRPWLIRLYASLANLQCCISKGGKVIKIDPIKQMVSPQHPQRQPLEQEANANAGEDSETQVITAHDHGAPPIDMRHHMCAAFADMMQVCIFLAEMTIEPVAIFNLTLAKCIMKYRFPWMEVDVSKAIAELLVAWVLQLVANAILLPWTRYNLNLSLPEVLRVFGLRKIIFTVTVICVIATLSMVRVMTLTAQGYPYIIQFCPSMQA